MPSMGGIFYLDTFNYPIFMQNWDKILQFHMASILKMGMKHALGDFIFFIIVLLIGENFL